jgi:uncharacterized damage-inducible protein DinB
VTGARRPREGEFAPYYGRYVALVPDGPITETLGVQITESLDLLSPLSEETARFRYAPGKWSVKEVVGHVADGERVFAYRALRFARGDATELPGFDQEVYAANARFQDRPLPDVLRELTDVRAATLSLFRSLGDEAWDRGGLANGVPVTVRALAWIIAGHERHHRSQLLERYLPKAP